MFLNDFFFYTKKKSFWHVRKTHAYILFMEKIISKAVIACGGYGTRFLPITKAVPKEMLPVIDKPTVAYIVEEMIQSGITDILIILGNGKESIKKYFSKRLDLERFLLDNNNIDALNLVQSISKNANISFVIQDKPRGSADAVWHAKRFVGFDSFVLAWGDDLIFSDAPIARQLIEIYDIMQSSVLGVQSIFSDDITKYGVIDPIKSEEILPKGTHKVAKIVEKPHLEMLPSRLTSLGRYILTPDIFRAIEVLKPAQNGEYQLTDAINALAKDGKMCAYEFEGIRYDLGDKFGMLKANVEYALRNEELKNKTKNYLDTLKFN